MLEAISFSGGGMAASRARRRAAPLSRGVGCSRSALPIALALTSGLFGQSAGVPLPDEPAGLDNIASALVSAFDQADIVALGEDHLRKPDSDVRIALVRHPDFPRRVRSIVVEFASAAGQSTLDRYIRGEDVPLAELEQVWTTTTTGTWSSPVYANFFAAVRDVNTKLPLEEQIHVFAGDPGKGVNVARNAWTVSVLKKQALEKDQKALLVYGAGHLFRTRADRYSLPPGIGGITKSLDADYPGRTFVVVTLGGSDPKYKSFEQALQTSARPLLLPLKRPPFSDFAAEDFLGPKLMRRLPGGGTQWIFQGSGVRLGDTADACLYSGTAADANPRVLPAR